jgi:hypothetical protein
MMPLINDQVLYENPWTAVSARSTQTIIDLPAAYVLNDSSLIDRVIAQIFDQLGPAPIELRISPAVPTARE